jgi:hypothetical protein
MGIANSFQTALFGAAPVRFEYYPVLLPDEMGMAEIAALNQLLIEHGLKLSQLTKLPHISINGLICPEDDEKVTHEISRFLSATDPLQIKFSGLGYYPGRSGLTLKLGIQNSEVIKTFNTGLMAAIGGKVTKLDLHLTLARYLKSEHWERLKDVDIDFHSCLCNSVAIYKKVYKGTEPYEVIGKVDFGKK